MTHLMNSETTWDPIIKRIISFWTNRTDRRDRFVKDNYYISVRKYSSFLANSQNIVIFEDLAPHR